VTADQTADTPPQTEMEKAQTDLASLTTQRDEAATTASEAAQGIEDLRESKGKHFKKSVAYPILLKAAEDAVAKVARLEPRIESLSKRIATEQFVEPLIQAFGTQEFSPAGDLPKRIALTDVDERVETLEAKFLPIQSTIAALRALQQAAGEAGIGPDEAAAMRPVRFVTNGNGSVNLAVAKGRGGGGGGGPRGTYRIVSVSDDAPDGVKALVNATVGKDSDVPSFKYLAETFSTPEQIDALTGLTSTGKPKSRSARAYCGKTFGMVAEAVESEAVSIPPTE